MTKPTKEIYPTHDAIMMTVTELVEGNTNDHQHGRESLDDIIADLTTYRQFLGTPEQYHVLGLL